LLGALALHPEFHGSFSYLLHGMPVFSWTELGDRIARATIALAPYRLKGIFTHYRFATYVALAAALLLLVSTAGWALTCRRRSSRLLAGLRSLDDRSRFITFLLTWIAGAIIAAYVLFLSPFHAIGGRYLAVAWPFVAFVPVLILRFDPRRMAAVAALLCGVMALSGFSYVLAEGRYDRQGRPARSVVATIASAPSVLLDEVEAGFQPRHVRLLADDVLIYGAQQKFISEHEELWLPRIEPGSYYVSSASDGNDDVRREAILDIIRRRYSVERLPGRLAGLGDVYRIGEQPAASIAPLDAARR